MHEAQGETVKQGPSSRGEAWRGVPRPPAKLPRRGASPLAALARVRRVRRVPSSYRRLELSTRRGVIHARVSPRCPSERRWAAASGSSCNLPPSSPRTETVFLLFIFFLRTRCCCLPPQPLPAAGRHRWAAAFTSASGWDGNHRSTAAVTGSSSPSTARRMTRRETPASWAQVLKKRCKGLLGKEQRGMIAGSAPSLRRPSRSKGPLPGLCVPVREVEGSRRQGRKRRRGKQGNADCSWRGSRFSHLLLSSLLHTEIATLINVSGEQIKSPTIKCGIQNYP